MTSPLVIVDFYPLLFMQLLPLVDLALALIFCTPQMRAFLEYNPFLRNLTDHLHLLVYVPFLPQIFESNPLMSNESPPVNSLPI